MSDERKRAVLAAVRSTHAETMAFFGALSPAELDAPVYGEGVGWRVRDLPPHLALWQTVSTRVAEKIARTGTLPDTDDWDVWAGELTPTDELNDRVFHEWRDRDLPAGLASLDQAQAALAAALERLSDEQLTAGDVIPDQVQPYLRAPGLTHPRSHRAHVIASLERGPAREAKERFIGELERVHGELVRAFRALDPAAFERSVFTGEGEGWTVRDLLPHLALWQRVAAQIARRVAWHEPPLEGEPFRRFLGQTEPTDAFNERAAAEWRGRTIAEQFAELDAAHRALVDALRVLPAARVVKDDGTPFRYFWQPGANHLRQHWAHVEAALKESATT